jgi:hypothetical protein
MRLAETISVYAGGPGSGCQGPNCGRPAQMINDVKKLSGHKATIQLQEREGRVRVKDLSSNEKGQGHASKLLRAVTDLADKHGVTMELTASPYGDEKTRLDHDQLKSFYGRHGFTNEPGYDEALGYMIREPQNGKN